MELSIRGDLTPTELVQIVRLCAELNEEDPDRFLFVRMCHDDGQVINPETLLQDRGISFLHLRVDRGDDKEVT